eukprot:m.87813 g.87813  ORF g.87813 m.87813 type:complete len:164 (-) comp12841_c0_seq8:204-695(-)
MCVCVARPDSKTTQQPRTEVQRRETLTLRHNVNMSDSPGALKTLTRGAMPAYVCNRVVAVQVAGPFRFSVQTCVSGKNVATTIGPQIPTMTKVTQSISTNERNKTVATKSTETLMSASLNSHEFILISMHMLVGVFGCDYACLLFVCFFGWFIHLIFSPHCSH